MPDSDASPNLELPFVLPAQAQKHVTLNEALRKLDLIVQLVVRDFGSSVPPTLPEDGDIWALGDNVQGDWLGHSGQLAAWLDGNWFFVAPRLGWRAFGAADGSIRVWSGTNWERLSLDNLVGLGIGTAHDPTNRLAVSASATLFTHAGSGHRLTINKATATDTATIVYQSDWVGTAEMGLAGNNDFSIKVSPNGSNWTEALRINSATGVTEAFAGLRVEGRQAYHRGNVLGSVSQSSGVPTGGLVETGTNANGRYVRFADGTQMCWRDSLLSQSVAANSYAEVNWVYPAIFAGVFPHPSPTTRSFNDASGRQNAARYLRGVSGGNGLTSGVIGVFNAHSSAIEARVDAFVVGRWF